MQSKEDGWPVLGAGALTDLAEGGHCTTFQGPSPLQQELKQMGRHEFSECIRV